MSSYNKFTFAISSLDEFLYKLLYRCEKCTEIRPFTDEHVLQSDDQRQILI